MGDLHPIKAALLVGFGGSLGALARYYVSVGARRWLGDAWPFGTLGANLLGCLALGLMAGFAATRDTVTPELRAALMVGFLGAFTTFSTFSLESVTLLREAPSPLPGVSYVLVSVLAGLGLAYAGYRLGA